MASGIGFQPMSFSAFKALAIGWKPIGLIRKMRMPLFKSLPRLLVLPLQVYMGSGYFLACFGGRPRGRMVDSSPSFAAVFSRHFGFPKGAPRFTLSRIASSSAASSL